MPDTLAGLALNRQEVDIDSLWGEVEHGRLDRAREQRELTDRIEETRRAKQQAIETRDFEAAARLRDQEAELLQGAQPQPTDSRQLLSTVRERLGIPDSAAEKPRPPDTN